MRRTAAFLGPFALPLFVLTVAGFGLAITEYSQRLHPVALLGAEGTPHALAFNLLGFVLPGAIAACVAWRLREVQAPSRWSGRIGAQLTLLSAIAFAAQGLLPIDPFDIDGPASSLHAVAWTLWWIAFVLGAAMLAIAMRVTRPAYAVGSALVAVAVLLLASLPWPGLPAAITQRLAFVLWLAWVGVTPRFSATHPTDASPVT